MNIAELAERSKQSFEHDPKKLRCADDCDTLVILSRTERLLLEPIWDNPIDDIEGPLYRQYIAENPKYNSVFLRQKVAKRLCVASQKLPDNLKLIVRAGHRPLAVQSQELQQVIDKYLTNNAKSSQNQAVAFARTFIDDPKIKLPSHCCGAAVDVDVLNAKTGDLVDFGSSVNDASNVSFLHSDTITRDQYANRMVLLEAMLKAGFAPSYVEWWHFSYGDTVWAYFYDKPKSLYGVTEPKL